METLLNILLRCLAGFRPTTATHLLYGGMGYTAFSTMFDVANGNVQRPPTVHLRMACGCPPPGHSRSWPYKRGTQPAKTLLSASPSLDPHGGSRPWMTLSSSAPVPPCSYMIPQSAFHRLQLPLHYPTSPAALRGTSTSPVVLMNCSIFLLSQLALRPSSHYFSMDQFKERAYALLLITAHTNGTA